MGRLEIKQQSLINFYIIYSTVRGGKGGSGSEASHHFSGVRGGAEFQRYS